MANQSEKELEILEHIHQHSESVHDSPGGKQYVPDDGIDGGSL
ncbi:MAG TPA: hypothetical protein VMW69_05515 [Spirochaetia bacterium]|nr:hypothetical protein [Spirochaetia bacterium]